MTPVNALNPLKKKKTAPRGIKIQVHQNSMPVQRVTPSPEPLDDVEVPDFNGLKPLKEKAPVPFGIRVGREKDSTTNLHADDIDE